MSAINCPCERRTGDYCPTPIPSGPPSQIHVTTDYFYKHFHGRTIEDLCEVVCQRYSRNLGNKEGREKLRKFLDALEMAPIIK